MRGYNHVTLVGNLVSDPNHTNEGKASKTTFTLAVGKGYKKNDEDAVDFIPIVVWGKLAEICNEYLVEGKRVLIDGKVVVKKITEGEKITYLTQIVADEMTLLSNK